ncbi:hypothetical protein MIMGU_mgv1a015782mg [Erythranthe guttata]|uniref:Uncharacterized protein n=1 Tax=Erythranthe guttata TaxID=4155 RepID=A0A022RTM8_ERYGU|nr:hypothetical protein MIMGU_mgv1a015782mg [Erythranthe guttata]
MPQAILPPPNFTASHRPPHHRLDSRFHHHHRRRRGYGIRDAELNSQIQNSDLQRFDYQLSGQRFVFPIPNVQIQPQVHDRQIRFLVPLHRPRREGREAARRSEIARVEREVGASRPGPVPRFREENRLGRLFPAEERLYALDDCFW